PAPNGCRRRGAWMAVTLRALAILSCRLYSILIEEAYTASTRRCQALSTGAGGNQVWRAGRRHGSHRARHGIQRHQRSLLARRVGLSDPDDPPLRPRRVDAG